MPESSAGGVSFDHRAFRSTWLTVQCCGRPMEVTGEGTHFGGPLIQDHMVLLTCPDCQSEVSVQPMTSHEEDLYEPEESA